MNNKIRLGISTCLLGENVRYDGGHKLDHFLKDTLGSHVEWVPVCPEVECGLPVPREAMHLVGDPKAPRLVTVRSGKDHTERMFKWAKQKLAELEKLDLAGFVFKSRSPSSGISGVKVYTRSGMPYQKGIGIFPKEYMIRFPHLPAEDDGRLHDPRLRENFIERIFVYKRWQEFIQAGGSLKDLVAFHTDHKLLLLAHSPKHYTALGKLVASAKHYTRANLHQEYIDTLMAGLGLLATVKKNTNVLQHMMGYLKTQLTVDEKRELLDVLDNYHKGIVPLIVPVTLLQHYVRKYDVAYLRRQQYLNPHPLELMLRNHV